MTRKDYVKFAQAIKREREIDGKDALTATKFWQSLIANIFEQDNPQFDREKFYQACEPKKGVENYNEMHNRRWNP